MSHLCMVNERQRFPVLRKRMDDVVGNFLRDGLQPSQTMIGHLIEMEVWWIWGFLMCLIAPDAYCLSKIEIHGRDKTYLSSWPSIYALERWIFLASFVDVSGAAPRFQVVTSFFFCYFIWTSFCIFVAVSFCTLCKFVHPWIQHISLFW